MYAVRCTPQSLHNAHTASCVAYSERRDFEVEVLLDAATNDVKLAVPSNACMQQEVCVDRASAYYAPEVFYTCWAPLCPASAQTLHTESPDV